MNIDDVAVTRRGFVKAAVVSGLAAGPLGSLAALAAEPRDGVPYRKLGRTGERVSMIGLGGFHIGMQKTEEESIGIIRAALDRGINFLDNCWDYNEGASEIRMGKALRDGYREKAFLMTKIDGRTKAAAAAQIDESLRRLQTDHVDLCQFHEIIRLEDPDRVFAEGGALEAMKAARKAGKVRYIGFTGHKSPAIHLKMLAVAKAHDFHFDTVQMPLNVMDAHYDSFEKAVLPVLLEREIGVLGMKAMGDHYILKSGTVNAIECLHYTMNLPTSVTITGIDAMPILEQAFEAMRTFKPMNEAQVAALLARTAPAASKGKFERYKISQRFDGTAEHPEWLG